MQTLHMEESVIGGDDGRVTVELAPADPHQQTVDISRKNSAATKNMAETVPITNDVIVSTDDVIVSNDDVIISRTVILQDETTSVTEISAIPKTEFEDCEEIDSSSAGGLAVTSTSFTPSTTYIPRTVLEDEWRIAAQHPVLHVHCKKITGELHKNRFGSGAKGKCIKVGKLWFTPTEFEAHCGRSASKDWKRSIRFQGVTLNDLIEEGYVLVHASCCACAICLEDNLAAGPVRLYQHYKRRKKNSGDDVKTAYKGCISVPYQTVQSNTITIPMANLNQLATASVAPGSTAVTATEVSIISDDSFPHIADLPLDKAWALMSETLLNLLKSTSRAREMLEELRQRTNKELEDQRRFLLEEKEAAVHQAKLEAQLSSISSQSAESEFILPVEVQPHSVAVCSGENAIPTSSLQPDILGDLTTDIQPLNSLDGIEDDKKKTGFL